MFAAAGDICAVTGFPDVKIGETIVDPESPLPLPTIEVEEPTVTMTFLVNTSPFAGQEGQFVTSRNIKDRLDRELERNLALRVSRGDSADTFIVSGRGGLHLGILIETMRREGFEFAVGPMMVGFRILCVWGGVVPSQSCRMKPSMVLMRTIYSLMNTLY